MLEHFLRDGVVGHLSVRGIEQEQGYGEIHDLKNMRVAGGFWTPSTSRVTLKSIWTGKDHQLGNKYQLEKYQVEVEKNLKRTDKCFTEIVSMEQTSADTIKGRTTEASATPGSLQSWMQIPDTNRPGGDSAWWVRCLLSIPRSSVRFRLKPDTSNSHEFELHRPSNKGTKLLLKVIKAIIIITESPKTPCDYRYLFWVLGYIPYMGLAVFRLRFLVFLCILRFRVFKFVFSKRRQCTSRQSLESRAQGATGRTGRHHKIDTFQKCCQILFAGIERDSQRGGVLTNHKPEIQQNVTKGELQLIATLNTLQGYTSKLLHLDLEVIIYNHQQHFRCAWLRW